MCLGSNHTSVFIKLTAHSDDREGGGGRKRGRMGRMGVRERGREGGWEGKGERGREG